MNVNQIIKYWQKELGLLDWSIYTEEIKKDQVLYNNEVPNEDRYFVGVEIDGENNKATIYHDRELNDEYVLHELLHVKYPKFSEDQVNFWTDFFLLENKN